VSQATDCRQKTYEEGLGVSELRELLLREGTC
jgi:hypothetical protein